MDPQTVRDAARISYPFKVRESDMKTIRHCFFEFDAHEVQGKTIDFVCAICQPRLPDSCLQFAYCFRVRNPSVSVSGGGDGEDAIPFQLFSEIQLTSLSQIDRHNFCHGSVLSPVLSSAESIETPDFYAWFKSTLKVTTNGYIPPFPGVASGIVFIPKTSFAEGLEIKLCVRECRTVNFIDKKLRDFVAEDLFCDLEIRSECGECKPVHGVVIAAASEELKNALNFNPRNAEKRMLHITELKNRQQLDDFVELAYGKRPVGAARTVAILEAVHMWLPNYLGFITAELERCRGHISLDVSIQMFCAAALLGLENLKTLAIDEIITTYSNGLRNKEHILSHLSTKADLLEVRRGLRPL